jgi:hypothetical protein
MTNTKWIFFAEDRLSNWRKIGQQHRTRQKSWYENGMGYILRNKK